MLRYLLILFSLMVIGIASHAQEHRKVFGQNRVQYKDFDWFYYSTDDYDIHYYHLGEEYAQMTLDFLDKEYEKITDMIGYAPFAKTKIFLYNSEVDIQQSNIGVNGATFTIAGQTVFVKLQVEIAYPGNIVAFKKELRYKMTQMLLHDMMFGGSLAEMFQSAYLLNLPEWFIKGGTNYIAYGWDIEMDDYMRDMLVKKRIKKLSKLEDADARLIGQSVWNYIAVKYGPSNISNILNLTRIIRNVENAIASTIGIPFKQFRYEWEEYYRKTTEQIESSYVAPDKQNLFKSKAKSGAILTKVAISPDGKLVAYIENYKGKYKVIIRDLASGKERTALKGGYHIINQEVAYDLPIIDWVNSSKLGIVQNWYGANSLVTYDLITKTRQRKSLVRFNQVNHISFNDNGKLAVISADIQGQNDLYLISMRRNAIKRLTKDQWDDLYPKFIPGTDAIVFSSNRPTDSLTNRLTDITEAPDILNLFAYDLDTTRQVLYRLTNTLSDDINPVPIDRENIFYLSDQKGINNIYKYNFADGIYTQVSNYNASLKEYDIDPTNKNLTYLMLQNGRDRIFLEENYDIDQTVFTPQTVRNQIKQIEYIRERREKRQEEASLFEGLLEDEEPADSVRTIEQTDNQDEAKAEDLFIDTDDFQFEEEPEDDAFSFLSTYQKLRKEPTVTGPMPYHSAFTANNLITSFRIDPIRGFAILMESEMTDILENHKFYGGFLAVPNFSSGDFFAEYQYLKNTIDLKVRYERNVYLIEQFSPLSFDQDVIQKYRKNTYTLGASLPVSVASRFGVSAFMAFTDFYNLNSLILTDSHPAQLPGSGEGAAEESQFTFAGLRAEWVFDNTLTNGLNLYEGMRGKVSIEHYQGVNDASRTFTNINVDLRRYQKIHRELIIAARLYYGQSFGNHPKTYMLGGIDNWVANESENTDRKDSPLFFSNTKDNTDILFADFVNLRGFNYNQLSGSNVLTFNTELRFPIIKYFTRGSIKSNFLRNLQFIGFYDIGSAWTGKSPFQEGNTVNTKIVSEPGSVFEAIVKTSRNPWLQSYGFGLRTVMLGYYVRLDFSYPIEDYQVDDMKFYLSLGYDF